MHKHLKAGCLLAAALLCAGTAWGQTKLRAWNIHPDGYPVTEAMKRLLLTTLKLNPTLKV